MRAAWSTLAVAFAAATVWALGRFWRVVRVGSAYKAKVLCSLIFGTGRTIDAVRAEEVRADSYWPLRLLRSSVNEDEQSVTASFLGLGARSAVFRPGLGATLTWPEVRSDPPVALPNTVATPWPKGNASASLQRVVEAAFMEPDATKLRRTRAIVIVHDGRIVAERYGAGLGETTRFAGWSMTKSVLSALIGTLVGEGRLSLQSRAPVPEWRAPDPRADITIEDLLRMRSGLKFSEVYDDLSSDVIQMLFNRSDTAAFAAGRSLTDRPGTVWSYASGTTNILSGIARRIVGDRNYFTWPRRALFNPVGMSSAILEPDGAGTFVGSSFMLATARDWARFGQLYLQDGIWDGRRILPDGWVRFSTSPTLQSPGGIYGAHWWLGLKPEMGGETREAARIPPDAFFAVGHEGQVLTVVPSLRLVVVRLGLSIYVDAWNHAAWLADIRDAL